MLRPSEDVSLSNLRPMDPRSLSPLRRPPPPPFFSNPLIPRPGQPASIARRHIRFHIRDLAHPRNNRAHILIIQDEPQRHLRQADPAAPHFLQFLDSLNSGLQILRHEIRIPPVARRPLALQRQPPSQRSLIKPPPRNHRPIFLPARRKQLIFRILIENVVNHLHGIHHSVAHRPYSIPRFPTIQAQPKRPHLFAAP